MNGIPLFQASPEADDQVSFRVDGVERLRWHCDPKYPRPFFYPLTGSLGVPLTRMGHPGAPNHDHHRSIWIAHEKVSGVNFWGDGASRIRQKQWLCYRDGDNSCAMAVLLGWFDGHDPKELLQQELIVEVSLSAEKTLLVEVQTKCTPTAETLEFGKTNFGFFAVRVAKCISEFFGGGLLTNSDGKEHEAAIFGKPAKWMDYSGTVKKGAVEGITYYDHPSNPGQPTGWHVREDGWVTASPCMNGPLETTKKKPLVLRYLLEAHSGKLQADKANDRHKHFAETPALAVSKAMIKHTEYAIHRVGDK